MLLAIPRPRREHRALRPPARAPRPRDPRRCAGPGPRRHGGALRRHRRAAARAGGLNPDCLWRGTRRSSVLPASPEASRPRTQGTPCRVVARCRVRQGRRGVLPGARAAGRRRRLGAAGRTRRRLRHLRRLRRVELRSRRGRLGRSADRDHRHGDHVPLHGPRPGRALVDDLHHRRRLRLRPAGPGPVGRVPDRHRHPRRVRHRPRGHRQLHQRLRRLADRHQRTDRLPRLLRRVHRPAHLRRRRGAEADVRDHRDRGGGAARLRRGRRAGVRLVEPPQHRRRHRRGRLQLVPALRLPRDLGCPPLRDLVLPRRRGCPARRRGDQGPGEVDAARHHRRDADAARVRRA